MSDRPILMSTPMIHALFRGTKKQTRRIAWRCPCKPGAPKHVCGTGGYSGWKLSTAANIKPGDRLWVRESWRTWATLDTLPPRQIGEGNAIEYAADQEKVVTGKMRPGIFMPRWASRLTLEVTHTRVERLQDISAADAASEGRPICDRCGDCGWINSGPDGGWQCDAPDCGISDIEWYAALWDRINGSGSWKANPEVVVIEFTVHRRNIDSISTEAA